MGERVGGRAEWGEERREEEERRWESERERADVGPF